jgi:8-oxo-dGTP pyrophosphatase MutT (NUDIX family)
MEKQVETLYDGDWFEHKRLANGLEFLQEPHDGVTVLCYNRTRQQFLLLHERVSATRSLKPTLTALTGSIDPGELPRHTALRELAEEAGVVLLDEALYDLGYVHTYKACTKKTYVFFADITGCEFIRATGDGSDTEEAAYVAWHTREAILSSGDALLLASFTLASQLLLEQQS